MQLVPAVGAGLQVARVVRSHDQAVTFSDGEDGEESTAPAKKMGIIYGLSLPADETVWARPTKGSEIMKMIRWTRWEGQVT